MNLHTNMLAYLYQLKQQHYQYSINRNEIINYVSYFGILPHTPHIQFQTHGFSLYAWQPHILKNPLSLKIWE